MMTMTNASKAGLPTSAHSHNATPKDFATLRAELALRGYGLKKHPDDTLLITR